MQLKQKQTLHAFTNRLLRLPKRYTIPTGSLLVVSVVYIAAFIIEKPIMFSYAGTSCVDRLTLLPDVHASLSTTGYEAHPTKLIKIGSWPIAARSVCVTATRAPQPGTAKVSLAPLGGVIARQTFAVTTAAPVVVDVSSLGRPVPVSRPLHLKLSGVDVVFSYMLYLGDKQAACKAIDMRLTCDVEKVGLGQGQSYPAKLVRQFNGKAIATVASNDIKTLSATTVIDSSIKAGATVYDKPMEVTITTDKKLVKGDVELFKTEGEKRTKVPSSPMVTETGITVKFGEELARSVDYELVVNKVEAVDGSGLVQPYIVAFKASGGPKVVNVNIGALGVSAGAAVIVTFDQALSGKQDISKYVVMAGGITLVGKQGNQLLFSVAGVPKCGDFSIKLTNDLQSQYDIGGNSAWSHASRTICHTVGTIGVSAQGRPINAYYFGSGATTVLYTGAIHGSEASTKSLMERWIQELEARARSIPAHITVVVVPAINPDGIARGSRVNSRNVDVNRNFATSDWQKDITTVNNQPFPGGGGESAMSEPETKAISALAQRLRPKVILSYHSIGSMVAANQVGNSVTLANAYAQLSGYRNITGQSDVTFEYSVTGTADDWYAQAIGVPSVLIELGSHSYHQFERNQAAMWAMINA